MRIPVFALFLLALMALPMSADAHSDRKRVRADDGAFAETERKAPKRRQVSRDSEMDIIRAESCDPAGRFSGYPAWARAAFTCGSQR